MTVVRIAIKKTLTQSAHSYLRAPTDSFSSEYLVRTDAPFPSPQLEAYALNIVNAESRLYLSCVRFESANVKLATPGAKPEDLWGRYSHIDLSELRDHRIWKPSGLVAMGEEDTLAFPSVTAVYVRQAQWGRNGRLLLPHALTTVEWNLYTQKGEKPLRFQKLSAPSEARIDSFNEELMEAIRAANGTYIMPGVAGENDQALRQVTEFVFTHFQVSDLRRKKKRGSVAARRAALRVSLQDVESESNSDLPLTKKRSKSKSPMAGVVYMLQAGPYFKIGMSINLEKRLGQIKLQLPHAVEVVHVIRAANPAEVEAHWHRRFAALRRNGEWFLLTQAEVDEFKSVSEM